MDIERGLVGEYNLAYFTATIHSWTIYHLLVVAAAIDVGQERCITGAGLDWVAKGASVHGSSGPCITGMGKGVGGMATTSGRSGGTSRAIISSDGGGNTTPDPQIISCE
jgi:hypothetical protein